MVKKVGVYNFLERKDGIQFQSIYIHRQRSETRQGTQLFVIVRKYKYKYTKKKTSLLYVIDQTLVKTQYLSFSGRRLINNVLNLKIK